MINAMSLKSRAKNLSKTKNLDVQEIMQNYMFERILERISVSKYKNNFILKGGLLLSSMMGLDNRTTKDMDTAIKGIDVDEILMLKVLREILDIDMNDGITFEINRVLDIKKGDKYEGNRYHIKAILENMKIDLSIDVSTGDIITPRELNYNYSLLFEDSKIPILSYNYETIIAEKLQTILSKGMLNSRMKDFYDLYFCINKSRNKLDISLLRDAIYNTFRQRDSFTLLEQYKKILTEYIDYDFMIREWHIYVKNHHYVENISFNEVVYIIVKFIDEIEAIQSIAV